MKLFYNKLPYKWIPFKILTTYVLLLLILSLIPLVRYKYDFSSLVLCFTYGFCGLSFAHCVLFEWIFIQENVKGLNSIIPQVFPLIPDLVALLYTLRLDKEFRLGKSLAILCEQKQFFSRQGRAGTSLLPLHICAGWLNE